MLLGQIARYGPWDPEERERAVVHSRRVGQIDRIEEDIAGGEVDLFPSRGQSTGSAQGDQREEIVWRPDLGVVIEAPVADNSSLQRAGDHRPCARNDPGRVRATERRPVLDILLNRPGFVGGYDALASGMIIV